MAKKPADSRTEQATPKRKSDARKRGEAARSTELPQAVTLVAAILVLVPVLSNLWARLQLDTVDMITNRYNLESQVVGVEAGRMMQRAAVTLVPMLALIIMVSVIAQIAMSGRPNAWKLKPKFDSLNPKNGLKRVFSRQQLWELVRTILKLLLLSAMAFFMWGRLSDFLALGPTSLPVAFAEWGGVVTGLAVGVAFLGVLIGGADAVISKRNFLRQLKMSRQEVKDEMKQSEGDPLIRSQIRQAQHRLSRSRMIAAVADATLVITNPTHLSIALKYQKGDDAPLVVAKGADEMAMRIRTEARRNGVPIRENKTIARTLFATVEVGDSIPVALYRAVAQLLASIYSAGQNAKAAT